MEEKVLGLLARRFASSHLLALQNIKCLDAPQRVPPFEATCGKDTFQRLTCFACRLRRRFSTTANSQNTKTDPSAASCIKPGSSPAWPVQAKFKYQKKYRKSPPIIARYATVHDPK